MRYIPESDTLFLSPSELSALRARQKIVPNVLSYISVFDDDGDDASNLQAFDSIPQDKQQAFLEAVKNFSAPECSILWHETVADQGITRHAAVWVSAKPGLWVLVSWNGEQIWLRQRTSTELALGLSGFLAVGPRLAVDDFRLVLSNDAALATLACLDYSLLAQIISMVNHSDPVLSFSFSEIQARIEDATNEDFRWPLLFVEKLIPMDLQAVMESQRLQTALDELVAVGILAAVEADQADEALYMFSENSQALRQGFLHETSKVGLCVSALSDSGDVAHEVFLFLRDPFGLWMFDLGGQEAAILSLDDEEWNEIIRNILDGRHGN